MEIKTKYNPGDIIWFFDKTNKPTQKEIKSIEFYKDKIREELFYNLISEKLVYKEFELFETQIELYASLEDLEQK
jgi:hypothetical protein